MLAKRPVLLVSMITGIAEEVVLKTYFSQRLVTPVVNPRDNRGIRLVQALPIYPKGRSL